MRNSLLIILLTLLFNAVFAQKSYIQVNGEPDLSVFLDNQFKGKTTVEYNGYIIENVNPGSHVIKIVKNGYTPYEETISVKTGEVLAYKVKPFAKHAVTISEQGNTAVTEKQAVVSTGKLVVQSVPIEIKISMPDIEGVRNTPKTKDEWIANDIPVGKYTMEFTFGNKIVKKQVEITSGDVTSAFVNMMSGEFTVKSSLTDKRARAANVNFFSSILNKYGIKRWLTPSEFFNNVPTSAALSRYKDSEISYRMPDRVILKSADMTPGPRSISFETISKKGVWSYTYCVSGFSTAEAALKDLQVLNNEFKGNLNLDVLYFQDKSISSPRYECVIDGRRVSIGFELGTVGKAERHEVRMWFGLF